MNHVSGAGTASLAIEQSAAGTPPVPNGTPSAMNPGDDDPEHREFKSVPDGSRCDEFVTRWNGYTKAGGKALLGLGKTLVDAKSILSDADFNQFCANIGLDPGGSTYRKFMKIGEMYPRLAPFEDKLPAAWTVVYPIACLGNDDFDRISGDLSPTMSAADLRSLRSGKDEGESVTRDLVLDLGSLDAEKKRAVCRELRELVKKFGFLMKPSPKLVNLLNKDKKPPSLDALFIDAIGAE